MAPLLENPPLKTRCCSALSSERVTVAVGLLPSRKCYFLSWIQVGDRWLWCLGCCPCNPLFSNSWNRRMDSQSIGQMELPVQHVLAIEVLRHKCWILSPELLWCHAWKMFCLKWKQCPNKFKLKDLNKMWHMSHFVTQMWPDRRRNKRPGRSRLKS
jgi:hypothetical protein